MSAVKQCSRCGADVPPVLGPPPSGRDTWLRFGVGITTTTRTHVLRFRMFKRRWLPENPNDQLSETYTTLSLCDTCAGDVFLFAQGKYEAGDPR